MSAAVGSLTAVQINDQLNRLLTVFRSNVPKDDERYAVMVREYCLALNGLSAEALSRGVTWLMSNRKERYWPLPAEIIEAAGKVQLGIEEQPGQPRESFMDKLRKRDAQRIADARTIQTDFEMSNRDLYEEARAGGWIGLLNTCVSTASRMVALRNESRSLGKFCPTVPMTDGGAVLENIVCHDGPDYIQISPQEFAKWRGYFAEEAVA